MSVWEQDHRMRLRCYWPSRWNRLRSGLRSDGIEFGWEQDHPSGSIPMSRSVSTTLNDDLLSSVALFFFSLTPTSNSSRYVRF
ncbi:hypothetical protein BT96DRAFT_122109 [Gymnopus androsaceus JB14]|uniref:Uncharacterized protein n=1 Tax=Gymnopus androsaceus JB14 TaxID=1447944 RepID=A0A6A4GC16_9AGAR|nr:hypothetical protein BT96DRAFT_122109 [Gymnopus androsaceus JB14]